MGGSLDTRPHKLRKRRKRRRQRMRVRCKQLAQARALVSTEFSTLAGQKAT